MSRHDRIDDLVGIPPDVLRRLEGAPDAGDDDILADLLRGRGLVRHGRILIRVGGRFLRFGGGIGGSRRAALRHRGRAGEGEDGGGRRAQDECLQAHVASLPW
jgi:hypothetical protein